MKTLVFISLVFAITLHAKTFTLVYLDQVTHGKPFHSIKVKASDFNKAITLSGKQCVKEMFDLNVKTQDIVDLCNNPRLK